MNGQAGPLEMTAKIGGVVGVVVAALTLVGGTINWAVHLGVSGVQAEVSAEKEMTRARLTFLEEAQRKDREEQRETLHALNVKVDSMERKVDQAHDSVELMRRAMLPKKRSTDQRPEWAQESSH